ncbi:MAG: hypothetical protein EOO59_05175 [Hymenobacter sp.]|nr:MAG: hypothetical protein EOO59_05175 [Hymenobacter sp.]
MRTCVRYTLGIGIALLAAHRAPAQQPGADSSLVAAARRALTQRYATGLGENVRLYNGPEYVSYVRRDTQGHRFFGTDAPQPATITYAGRTYAGVPLRYDLVRRQLVLRAPGGGLEMSLIDEQVARFEVGGHTFLHLQADSARQLPAGPGFYDLLVDGPVRLLGVHRKTLQKRSTGTENISEITARDEYFVERARRYYPVGKLGAVLHLFPENKAALRRFSKEHHLKFSVAAREQALVALLRYQATLAAAAPR